MSSGTMSDDEKTQTALRDTLEAVAGQTTVNSNWDRLVGDLDIERPSASLPSGGSWGRLAVAAAVAVVVAGGAYAVTQIVSDDTVNVAAGMDYVLPGETVLSTDPLIVSAAPGLEPLFDTSELGVEVVWQPAESPVEATRDAISFALSPPEDGETLTKAVALGMTAKASESSPIRPTRNWSRGTSCPWRLRWSRTPTMNPSSG